MSLLLPDPLPLVRSVEQHQTLGSTNDQALMLATRGGLPLPCLVLAETQTAGRGRGTNVWWSGAGAITVSLLLAPEELGVRPTQWPALTLTVAVAVCDALLLLDPGLAPVIKWPNDILLAGRKLAGLLVEPVAGAVPDTLVIGLGLNANNSFRSAPRSVAKTGIAVCDVLHRTIDRGRLIHDWLAACALRTRQLAGGDSALPAAWQTRDALRGLPIQVDSAAGTENGFAEGLTDDGRLMFRARLSGVRHALIAGRVRVLRPDTAEEAADG